MDELRIVEVNGNAVVLLPEAVVTRLGLRGATEVEYVWEGLGICLLPASSENGGLVAANIKPLGS